MIGEERPAHKVQWRRRSIRRTLSWFERWFTEAELREIVDPFNRQMFSRQFVAACEAALAKIDNQPGGTA